MPSIATTDKKTSNVPGQYLGYSLQATRCLARLLDANPGWTVSIEFFEDVGVETDDGDKIAEQAKSTVDGNPVSDRSVDLWKTFSNWVDAIREGTLDVNRTSFVLYVSCPKTGSIVQLFVDACSIEGAIKARDTAITTLWGEGPGFALKSNLSAKLSPFLEKVFNAEDELIVPLIQRFSLHTGSGSPHADLEVQFAKSFVPVDIQDAALKFALGWVKQQTDIQLEQQKPATVSVDAFRSAVAEFVRKHDQSTILSTYAPQPSETEINADLLVRKYVRQLELIECDHSIQLAAVIDFLRASVDRTRWGVRGSIDENDLAEFENSLIRSWKNAKFRVNAVHAQLGECQKGQVLYSECMDHAGKINGRELPAHFTPGSFHLLADNLTVGWHPDYETKLALVDEDEIT